MANTTDIRFFHAVVTDDLAGVRTAGKVAESTLYAAAREAIANDNPAILAELLQRGLVVDRLAIKSASIPFSRNRVGHS